MKLEMQTEKPTDESGERIAPTIVFTVNPYNMNKLCAIGKVAYELPVKYSYVVCGRTADANFAYSTIDSAEGEFELNPDIPVVGLYATRDTKVEITLLDTEGTVFSGQIIFTDWQETDFDEMPLTIDIEVSDQTIAEATIGQGWIVDSLFNGYDKNGDIRFTGMKGGALPPTAGEPFYDGGSNYLKYHNGFLYIAGEKPSANTNKQLYKVNLLGKKFAEFIAPEGYGFHHDISFDNQGNLYALASPIADISEDNMLEGTIFKYSIETGEIVSQYDFSQIFQDQSALANSKANDIHFNSIEYVEKFHQVIVNSRSCSAILGLDADTWEIQWLIDNPAHKVIAESLNLTVLNPDEFVYPNGEHAAFQTFNTKYSDYVNGTDKMAISMFDNKSCLFEDGTDNEKPISDPAVEDYIAYPFDSSALIYGIDLANRTVEFLDEFTIPGRRSEFICGVFDINNYYTINFGFNNPRSFFIFDTNNTIGVSVPDLLQTGSIVYRAKVITYDELYTML